MDKLIAALSASMDPVSTMGRIARQVRVFMPKADGAAVSVCTGDGTLVFLSADGISASVLGQVAPRQGSFQVLALETGDPQVSGEVSQDVRIAAHMREVARDMGIRSWMAVPLFHERRPVGVLSLVATAPDAFDAEDAAEVSSMSRFVATLIGSQTAMVRIVEDVLAESADPQQLSAAQFIASVLQPALLGIAELDAELDDVMAHPDQIAVVFQPVVDLSDGTILGFEGLTRFPHAPQRSTAQWFSAARHLGRGIELDILAMKTVLQAARAIPPGYRFGVNLGPLTVVEPSVVDIVKDYGEPMVIEITEHEPFPVDIHQRVAPLRACGAMIAVDDAGAGYANFAQLLRLRPDIIKIDGELVRGIEHDPVRRAMASAIVAIAKELGAHTVAEAIESRGQLDTLRALGIHRGQGHHLGRPTPAALIPTHYGTTVNPGSAVRRSG